MKLELWLCSKAHFFGGGRVYYNDGSTSLIEISGDKEITLSADGERLLSWQARSLGDIRISWCAPEYIIDEIIFNNTGIADLCVAVEGCTQREIPAGKTEKFNWELKYVR